MDIDHILQTELLPEDREVLADDRKRWTHLGSGAHLNDWLKFAPGLRICRKLAMKVNHKNTPKGRGYNETYGQLLRVAGFDIKDRRLMTTLTAVAWLDDDLERMTKLREIIDDMTLGERSRLNSPISARQRVERLLKARAGGADEKLRSSPVSILKQKNLELARQLAHADERLAAVEHVSEAFDLWEDNPKDISTALVKGIGTKGITRMKIVSICTLTLEALGYQVTKA